MQVKHKKIIKHAVCEGNLPLLDIYFLELNKIKMVLFFILSIFSVGIVPMVAYCIPTVKRWLMFTIVPNVKNATHFYIENWDHELSIVPKKEISIYDFELKKRNFTYYDITSNSVLSVVVPRTTFENRHILYIYSEDESYFKAMEFPIFQKFSSIRRKFAEGNQVKSIPALKDLYGECTINFRVPSRLYLFFKEIVHPFFIFQTYSIILYMLVDYILFGTFIACVSVLSAIVNFSTIHASLRRIHELVYFKTSVDIYRSDGDKKIKMTEVRSTELVPGDIIIIRDHLRIPCDCVLLSGQVLIDECSLTGESVPVSKFPIPNNKDKYISNIHKAYTLHEGTVVAQMLDGSTETLALVIRTGFSTIKGQLVRGIIYPKPHNLKFRSDSYWFLLFLLILSILSMAYFVPLQINKLPTYNFITGTLSIITLMIPVSLPAALTTTMTFSIYRIKKARINCISPQRVMAAGRIDCVCFDKTGTLTQEDMDIRGFKVASNGIFKEFVMPGFDKNAYSNSEDKVSIFRALAIMGTSHHVVSVIEKGKLTEMGDPMEIKMIKFSEYHYIPEKSKGVIHAMRNPVRNVDYIVVARFEFLSELARMSVIAQVDGRKGKRVYTKGAPELMKSICTPDSIPKNYDERLSDYTLLGYRVLALAWRDLTKSEDQKVPQNLARDKVESNLIFVGFLVFENMLKLESRGVIQKLNHAQIDSKIVTGDNTVTSIHVGREISILKSSTGVQICDLIEQNHDYYLQFKRMQSKDALLLANSNQEKEEMPRQGFTPSTLLKPKKVIENRELKEIPSIKLIKITQIILSHDKKKMLADGSSRPSDIILAEMPKGHNIEYAFTGKAFEFLQSHSTMHDINLSDWRVRTILLRSKIYARMQPNHKTMLMEMLQEHRRLVGMVGDGANDCGALQSADVGISLSQTEASISAPLTSEDGRITAVLDVLKEGRCILVSNIEIFKYMALYSTIQGVCTFILAYYLSQLSVVQMLWQDLFVVVPTFASMAWTGPYHELENDLPLHSLFTKTCILSIIGSSVIQGCGQFVALIFLRQRPEYVSPSMAYDPKGTTMEGDILFLFSMFTFIVVGITFNVSKPFRQQISSNFVLCSVLFIHFIFIFFIAFIPEVQALFQIDSRLTTTTIVCTILISIGFGVLIILYQSIFINMLMKSCDRLTITRAKERETRKLYGMVGKEQNKMIYQLAEVSTD